MADLGAGDEKAVVTFDGITVLTPRGHYNIELHVSFLRLQGQANDFKLQYSSVVHVCWLPQSINEPHTFVILTLKSPIRKGRALYPHIVMQFETDEVIDTTLSMSDELYDTKYKDKLPVAHKGLVHEIFITILCGLSGAKVTKPGMFRSHQDGYGVKSTLKAGDGVLYPLEESFFFLPKPPILILHDEIEYVEFERYAIGGADISYFDFLIRLKSDQELLFRNIQKNEYTKLFRFVNDKGLSIMNLGSEPIKREFRESGFEYKSVYRYPGRIKSEAVDSDEEVASKKKPKEEPSSSKKKDKDGEDNFVSKKKKKDSNAPTRAISAFMFFSQTERENMLAERWNQMTADEKAPYEAKALAVKKRYNDAISVYKHLQPTYGDSADESDSA